MNKYIELLSIIICVSALGCSHLGSIVDAIPTNAAPAVVEAVTTTTTTTTTTTQTAECVSVQWTCGGFNGSKIPVDPSVILSGSRLTTSAWRYDQSAAVNAWPDKGKKNGKYIRTIVCLFFEQHDGVYRGGKYDWGYEGTSPMDRPTSAHIQGGGTGYYSNWGTLKGYNKGQRYAGCVVRTDGAARSAFVCGVVE